MAAGEEHQGRPTENTQEPSGAASPDPKQLTVVGIGASAGGIQALQTFFQAFPPNPGIVFVVVMHLPPDRESVLPQVLQASTAMTVWQVRDRVRMEPNHVYVIPPNQHIRIADGHLDVSDFEEPRWQRAPIDVFFRTLADVHPDGIGILFSGSGTDGTVGLQAIKECGGITLVQLPEEAEFDAMPRSAIATGLIDFVLPAAELATKVVELHQYGLPPGLQGDSEDLPESEADVLRRILVRLQVNTGHDFSGYKNSTVLRRIERRMQVAQVETYADYLDYLRRTPQEARALLKDLLISVTHFFRDPAAFEALQQQVIPRLFEGKAPGESIRVWVAGCATGEEAYSIAMLLSEQADTLGREIEMQIFASDPDEEALAFAREGLYPAAIAADVSEVRLLRFFVSEGAYYRVRKDLRERVLFASHSILKDPPFSQIDLISCRNLLIYFERELQDKVYQLFHYALKPQGYLFLGSAESVESASYLFDEVDKAQRLYRRATLSQGAVRLPDLPLSTEVLGRLPRPAARGISPQQEASNAEQHRQALETQSPPSLLVDADGTIIHISETAIQYLQLSAGTPSLNLIRTILPALRLEMRSALYRATERHQPITTAPLPVEVRGQHRLVQLFVSPSPSGQVLVVFLDTPVPDLGPPRAEAPASDVGDFHLRQMEEELETTKAQLQSALESAETQQEELKAANEELQSINEEYRSTLEELETSKEELQSINEELKTVNQELNNKVEDLSQAHNNLQNLMAATDVPTLFVDRQLTIRLYTPPLTQIFNIMPVDQGRPLEHVTHRLTDGNLLHDVRHVLNTLVPIQREVAQDDGRYYLMRLAPYRTTDDYIDGVIITFVEITSRKRMEEELRTFATTLEQRVAERTAEREAAYDTLRRELAERQRMQEALFQREKLAALGLLLANVAHELNNPLSVATMEIDNLEEIWPAGVEAEGLDTLRQAVERCNSVVQSFLALARQQSTTRSSLALNALIEEVLVLLKHGLEADGIGLELRLAESLPPIEADANQLHHVIANLITNAHQALRQSEPPRQLTLTTAADADGTQVILEVADTGPGISPELQHRVFEPFFTTRPQAGGSGLGLSLCRSVIETHGGTIRLSSQEGQGTTVYITLPIQPADVQAPETPGEAETSEPTQRGRILLIDDEDSVRRALTRLLARSGHDVDLAANGHEGLAALEERSYDVIMCDIRMPDLDGPGFYREVARVYPHLVSRLIFLTGDVLSSEVQTFFDQTACLHLVKPFQAREARRLIQQIMEAQ